MTELAVFACSPYLASLARRYPELYHKALLIDNYQEMHVLLGAESFNINDNFSSQAELMRALRISKQKLALLVAIADLRGVYSVEQVTRCLSDFADLALKKTLDFLLLSAANRAEIILKNRADPSYGSGIIILGMGKLGAYELNYSSDIDIIFFFEKSALSYNGRAGEAQFMNKLVQDIITIMQERTGDGYVFRTDIRLRPDPASTSPAINIEAAYYYYESVGQNWERAAMIKARPVAGDKEAGERFLQGLAPYIWRRNLDFAAIDDIHSIKRQMDARGDRVIGMSGHNIKLGIGGIREIEFYTQIHQLIWGGRKPSLRLRATIDSLAQLAAEGLISAEARDTLTRSYRFLRVIEHRLQMVDDEQTHTLPADEEKLQSLAIFSGYSQLSDFEADLLRHLHDVHDIYRNSFRSSDTEELADNGNLVFTGVSHDPETLITLQKIGYQNPQTISEIVMGWHHGAKRCTRTKRAREMLTELMPSLLKRMAETANPDAAFLKFDEFLTYLPAAIQLFSLLQANKGLLGLIADIMGSAPALAERLSKSPELIESVLFSDFYKDLPDKTQLAALARERLAFARDQEEALNFLVYFRNERQFQAGVQFLNHMIDGCALGNFLTNLAEITLAELLAATRNEFEKTYGNIAGAEFCVIALGKCGSRELTFHSDLDLIFVYRVPDFEALSDGERSHNASVYYNRFAQRLVGGFSQLTRSGKLYEIDTRLRPSGKQGLLAISDRALVHYFSELAWTFEYMALTKARVIAGDKALSADITLFIENQLQKPRNQEVLLSDVNEMRLKMAESYATENPWDVKHVRGGMADIDFIAQYMLLLNGNLSNKEHKEHKINSGSSEEILLSILNNISNKTEIFSPLNAEQITQLRIANSFFSQLFHMLRLCTGGELIEENVLPGLKKLLCATVKIEDFAALKEKLLSLEQSVWQIYSEVFREARKN